MSFYGERALEGIAHDSNGDVQATRITVGWLDLEADREVHSGYFGMHSSHDCVVKDCG